MFASARAGEREGTGAALLVIPTIDLEGINSNSFQRAQVVDKIRYACEKWGFFQVQNGIPVHVLDTMLHGIRDLHEHQNELTKKHLCSKDSGTNKDQYTTRNQFFKSSDGSRDSFVCYVSHDPPTPEALPSMCREIVNEYAKRVKNLGSILFELLSEALGLDPKKLKDMDCGEEFSIMGHYYPPCPDTNLTFGTKNHTDGTLITILLQDQVGGLHVLYQNQWVDVPPMHGALVVNVGELLQLISNDKFISVNHRVIAQTVGSRISVPSFFKPHDLVGNSKVYGPIEELLSEENPKIYREVSVQEYLTHYLSERIRGTSALEQFKL